MGNLLKISMFITSFIPLWITIVFINVLSLIRNTTNLYTEKISIAMILAANLISILVIFTTIGGIQPSEYGKYKVIDAKQEKGITSEFLLSYVLPLFAFDFTLWFDFIQFSFFFVVLLFLCYRNNNVYANLLFEIKGYKFYDCEVLLSAELDKKSVQTIIIAKDNINAQINNTIQIACLNKPFYIMKELEE